MKRKSIFDKEYFDSYYHHISGDFARKDLEKNERWYKGWLDFISKYVPIYEGHGKNLIEVGSAIAAPSNILLRYGYKAIATDVSTGAVKKASRLSSDIHFRVWDVQKEPSKEFIGKFDLLLGFEVIEHLSNPEKAISHFFKILKKGGWCVLSTPYPYKKSFNDKTHINVRYPGEWESVLKKAGFGKIIIKEATFIPNLYRYSSIFSKGFPFGTSFAYVNSTVFLMAQKK